MRRGPAASDAAEAADESSHGGGALREHESTVTPRRALTRSKLWGLWGATPAAGISGGRAAFGQAAQQPIGLGLLAATSLILTLFFQWYIVATLGAGSETDALFIAMVVPQLILSIASAAITSVLVPLFSTRDDIRLRKSGWTIVHGAFLVLGTLVLLFAVTASIWVPWIAPGFDQFALGLTVTLVRVQLPGMLFAAVAVVLWSAACARGRFVWAESSALLPSVFAVLLLIWALPRYGVTAAAWALAAKPALHVLLLLPVLGAYAAPDWKDDVLTEGWHRAKPLLLGAAYYRLDEVVDRMLSSLAAAGGLTLFYLAQRLWGAGNAVLSKAIVAPVVPVLARAAESRDWVVFRRTLNRRLLAVMVSLSAGGLAVFLAGNPMLTLVFRGSHLGPQEIAMLWWLLIALLGAWFGGTLAELLAASFYAAGDTTIPTRIGVFGFTLGVGMKIGGFYLGGLSGLALGTSVFYILNTLLLYGFLMRFIMNRGNDNLCSGMLRA
jgi:putative peptidoglycan lipid II flippase